MDNLKTYGIFIQREEGECPTIYWTSIFELIKVRDSVLWKYSEDIHKESTCKNLKLAINKAKKHIKKYNIPFIRYVNEFWYIDYVDGDIENCVYEVPEPPWTT